MLGMSVSDAADRRDLFLAVVLVKPAKVRA
jgi:hypothetical protein